MVCQITNRFTKKGKKGGPILIGAFWGLRTCKQVCETTRVAFYLSFCTLAHYPPDGVRKLRLSMSLVCPLGSAVLFGLNVNLDKFYE